jgi:hypothetical protein
VREREREDERNVHSRQTEILDVCSPSIKEAFFPKNFPLRSMYSKETFFIGVRIRRGDSCTTRAINTGRHPCQEVSVCAKFVILVASDSEHATKE